MAAHTVDVALSAAILKFLSVGESPYPKRNPDVVIEEFGAEVGTELVAAITVILGELFAVTPDWVVEDLVMATDRAEARMRETFPELSDEAIDALGWAFSFARK